MTFDEASNFIVNPKNGILRLHVIYKIIRELKTNDVISWDNFLTIVVPEGVNKDRFIERELTRYLKQNTDVYSFEKYREEYKWV